VWAEAIYIGIVVDEGIGTGIYAGKVVDKQRV
jgi:hypothetical protein